MFAYDAAGNRTTHAAPNGVTTAATFDGLNRVETVTSTGTADADGNDSANDVVYDVAYKYDLAGAGRSSSETVIGQGMGQITWGYDGLYLHGPGVDQVLAREDGQGGVRWLLADDLGSIRDVADNGGTLVNHLVYDSYGNLLSQSAAGEALRYGFRDGGLAVEPHQSFEFFANAHRASG